MRISDWSSNVCSSDLRRHRVRDAGILVETGRDADGIGKVEPGELGRQHRARQRMPRTRQGLERVQRQIVRRLAVGRSEEHTSELQSLMRISYAVFCLKKKKTRKDKEQCTDQNTT